MTYRIDVDQETYDMARELCRRTDPRLAPIDVIRSALRSALKVELAKTEPKEGQ